MGDNAATTYTVTSDVIGNPTSDGTWSYTWEKGRQLKQMSKTGTTAAFKYNSEGLRVQKTVNGTVANYTLHGKNIVHMTQGSNTLHFWYDAGNRPAIVQFNGTKYAYIHNLQGDIVGILNTSGTEVVKYTYDAWGKVLTTTGSLASTLGTIQPFRYRGYVYDVETGMYYLLSRYYNPEWGRFINENIKLITSESFLARNVFSYALNDPCDLIDPTGFDAIWIQEGNSAKGFGHTGLMVQDEEKNWHYFFWGPESEEATKELITGTSNGSYVQKIETFGIELKDTDTIKEVLSKAEYPAASRAGLITSTYYFEGDYTATYRKAVRIAESGEDYRVLSNNCLQKTLSAFLESNSNFAYIIGNNILNDVIPNSAAARVELLPKKKGEFPWALVLIDALNTIY